MHILLTGASSGIGEAMARYWGGQGASITLVARREEKLREIAAELDGETHIIRADLSDRTICDGLVAEATEALGPIDVLVNNAGIQYVEPAVGVNAERLDRIVDVDLTTPLHLIRAALPDMLERGSGCIINVCSMASISHTPGMMHYNAVKAGLAAGSESLRVELRRSGVHVLTVYPGPVYTPMEAEGRAGYEDSWAVRFVPTGHADVLAKIVDRAMKRRKSRVIYPRFYAIARYFRVIAQWVTDISTPPVKPQE